MALHSFVYSLWGCGSNPGPSCICCLCHWATSLALPLLKNNKDVQLRTTSVGKHLRLNAPDQQMNPQVFIFIKRYCSWLYKGWDLPYRCLLLIAKFEISVTGRLTCNNGQLIEQVSLVPHYPSIGTTSYCLSRVVLSVLIVISNRPVLLPFLSFFFLTLYLHRYLCLCRRQPLSFFSNQVPPITSLQDC